MYFGTVQPTLGERFTVPEKSWSHIPIPLHFVLLVYTRIMTSPSLHKFTQIASFVFQMRNLKYIKMHSQKGVGSLKE